ncbi:MAG: SlyX family protein [Rhodoferax sp.]|nr:SlyX family protein [Rhodoferax sp.]
MSSPEELQDRLTQLEIKASFTEDLVDKLDLIVTRQQDQIDLLLQELRWLRQQAPEAGPAAVRNLRDDLPPHY